TTLRCRVRLYDAKYRGCKARAPDGAGRPGAGRPKAGPGSAGFEVAQAPGAAGIGLARRGCIEQHPLELREVTQEAPAPLRRDAAERLRADLGGLRDLDQLRGLEHLEVPAQIPVRQSAELLDHRERQALWIREQRRQRA